MKIYDTTTAEAAIMLKCTQRWVNKLIKTGRIPHKWGNSQYLLNKQDIKEFALTHPVLNKYRKKQK